MPAQWDVFSSISINWQEILNGSKLTVVRWERIHHSSAIIELLNLRNSSSVWIFQRNFPSKFRALLNYSITVMIEWEIVEIKLTRQFTKISIICTSRWKFEMIIFRSWRHESNSRKLLEAIHEILLSRSFDGNFQNKFSRNCSKNRCRNRKNY